MSAVASIMAGTTTIPTKKTQEASGIGAFWLVLQEFDDERADGETGAARHPRAHCQRCNHIGPTHISWDAFGKSKKFNHVNNCGDFQPTVLSLI